MNRRFGVILAGCAAVVASDAAIAQKKKSTPAPSPLVSAIERCRQVADPTQRLACYDSAGGALVQAANRGDVTVVDRQQVQQARRSLFGFTMPKLPFLSGGDDDQTATRLETTVKSVKALNNGRFQIVIADDGAVWEITEPPISFSPPLPGHKVTILRGPVGSYHLRVNGQVGVRGRRVS
jgi:hypothetical protein